MRACEFVVNVDGIIDVARKCATVQDHLHLVDCFRYARSMEYLLCYFKDCWERSLLATHMYIPVHFYYEIFVFPFFIFCINSSIVWGCVKISGKYLRESKSMSCIFYYRHSLYIRCVYTLIFTELHTEH